MAPSQDTAHVYMLPLPGSCPRSPPPKPSALATRAPPNVLGRGASAAWNVFTHSKLRAFHSRTVPSNEHDTTWFASTGLNTHAKTVSVWPGPFVHSRRRCFASNTATSPDRNAAATRPDPSSKQHREVTPPSGAAMEC